MVRGAARDGGDAGAATPRPARAGASASMNASSFSVRRSARTRSSRSSRRPRGRGTRRRCAAPRRASSPVADHLDQRHLAREVRPLERQVGDAVHRHQPVELRLDLLDHHLGAGGHDVDAAAVPRYRPPAPRSGCRCCSRGRRTGRSRGPARRPRSRPARRSWRCAAARRSRRSAWRAGIRPASALRR